MLLMMMTLPSDMTVVCMILLASKSEGRHFGQNTLSYSPGWPVVQEKCNLWLCDKNRLFLYVYLCVCVCVCERMAVQVRDFGPTIASQEFVRNIRFSLQLSF